MSACFEGCLQGPATGEGQRGRRQGGPPSGARGCRGSERRLTGRDACGASTESLGSAHHTHLLCGLSQVTLCPACSLLCRKRQKPWEDSRRAVHVGGQEGAWTEGSRSG